MIVGAAVCPGAPFLVKGVADDLGLRFADVRAACRQALDTLPTADSLVIVTGAGRRLGRSSTSTTSEQVFRPPARWLQPGTILRSTGIVRTDHPTVSQVELAPGGGAEAMDPATGSLVAAHLLTDAGISVPTTAVEIDRDPGAVACELAERAGSTARVAVLAIADGAACHGDGAPGRRDDRSAEFDERIARALFEGNPSALAVACADTDLNAVLLAGVDPLVVLAHVTAGRPPSETQLLYSGAPMGVGYFVGCWSWAQGEPA